MTDSLDGTTIIKKKGKKYSVQRWVSALKSWLVFDGFTSRKQAKEFIHDPKEQEEVEQFIQRTLCRDKK